MDDFGRALYSAFCWLAAFGLVLFAATIGLICYLLVSR